jgi:hypothetical protein
MTNIRTLCAVVIISAGVATPVFAGNADVKRPVSAHHVRVHNLANFRGAYNQSNTAVDAARQRNMDADLFGFIRGDDPGLYLPGN